MNPIDAMDRDAKVREYLNLAVCMGFLDGEELLIHFDDVDRHEKYRDAIKRGGFPVGKFFLYHSSEFGCLAGCERFRDDPAWDYIFKREMAIMQNLITEDPAFRTITTPKEFLVH
jgi:hypothetical protein